MSQYYDDLAGDKLWSSFLTLVDVVDQEHSLRLAEKGEEAKFQTMTVSVEEKVNYSFWDFVPRKRRSSSIKYVTRRNQQKPLCNLKVSSLLDLNKIPEGSETQGEDPQHNSRSSVYEKTEAERNPNFQSSETSCVTENRSRKRPAVEQRKISVVFKKAKVSPFKAVETPVWLDQVMQNMKGGAVEPKLIFEKTLYTTDVNPSQSRLSLPFNKLIRTDFLTPEESRIIEEDIENNEKTGVGAILVDQRSEKWGVMFKRWEMKKDSGKGSWSYALNCGWNEIVEANGLRAGHKISLWSLRWRGVLCFALVPLPLGHNSSSLAL